MAVRKRKPTSPAVRRFQTVSDFGDVTTDRPEKSLLAPKPKTGRSQQPRPQDLAPPRRRSQAAVPHHRLQASQGRGARQGRLDRVRPQPHLPHRAAALRGRREALHPGAQGPQVGDSVQSGQGSEIRTGNALPLRFIPVGTVIHNVELRPAPAARWPLRRLERPAGREWKASSPPCPALDRDAPRADRLPRHHRRGRQLRARPHQGRQGRPQPLEGRSPPDAGVAMNPVDHPHGGGEGKTSGGRHPCRRGQARGPYPRHQQAVPEADRPSSPHPRLAP